MHKKYYNGQKYPSGLFNIGRLFEDPLSGYSELTMDELSIWNQELTQNEIEAVMVMTENSSD